MSDHSTASAPRPARRRRTGRRSQSKPEQVGSEQTNPEPAKSGQPKAEQARTEPAKSERSRPAADQSAAAVSETAGKVPRRRSRSRRGGKAKKVGNNVQYPGQVTNDTSVPRVAAPSRRGKRKRPLAAPRIGVGCVILRGDQILLVRERGRWSLPKGGLEAGELIQDGARRETYEETGLVIELRDLAFVVEFQAESWGHHLQFFYTGREVGGELSPKDPDRDVQEARFVPIRELREYIRFRPRLVSLETWLHERRPRHFVFNLDQEPAMLRRRRRPGVGEVQRGSGVEPQDIDLD